MHGGFSRCGRRPVLSLVQQSRPGASSGSGETPSPLTLVTTASPDLVDDTAKTTDGFHVQLAIGDGTFKAPTAAAVPDGTVPRLP